MIFFCCFQLGFLEMFGGVGVMFGVLCFFLFLCSLSVLGFSLLLG